MKISSNERWHQTQDFGDIIGCKISDRPLGWWHKFYVFSNANMLDTYINTFMKSEEYICDNFNGAYGKVQAMKAISAIHKSKTEARSFFWGLAIGLISFGISLITFLPSVKSESEYYLSWYMYLIYIFFCIVIFIIPLYQTKHSIISSAINDAIDLFEKEYQSNDIQKRNKNCKNRRK